MAKEPSDKLDRLAYQVIGAAIEVHREIGPGFSEKVYENALAHELGLRNVAFRTQVAFDVLYKGMCAGTGRLDFLVEDTLVVELKAVEKVLPVHLAQILSYLRAYKQPLGLLLNFEAPVMRDGVHRVVFSP